MTAGGKRHSSSAEYGIASQSEMPQSGSFLLTLSGKRIATPKLECRAGRLPHSECRKVPELTRAPVRAMRTVRTVMCARTQQAEFPRIALPNPGFSSTHSIRNAPAQLLCLIQHPPAGALRTESSAFVIHNGFLRIATGTFLCIGDSEIGHLPKRRSAMTPKSGSGVGRCWAGMFRVDAWRGEPPAKPGGRPRINLPTVLYHPLKWITRTNLAPFRLGYSPSMRRLQADLEDAGFRIEDEDCLALRKVLGTRADGAVRLCCGLRTGWGSFRRGGGRLAFRRWQHGRRSEKWLPVWLSRLRPEWATSHRGGG
jgi:hypothetical protein